MTLTSIPHVESSSFREYLSQVGPVFEAFNRAKAANEEAASSQRSARPRASERDDDFAEVFGRHMRKEDASSPTSPTESRRSSVVSSPLSPEARRGSKFGSARRTANAPTPLSVIPNVYFEEDFRLENPRTFDVVSEFAEIIPPERGAGKDDGSATNGSARPPRRRALHTNAILQEKLSWYMDTVEVHLISSIAAASTSFFAALGSLKELQSEATDCIDRIQSLRSALQELNTKMAIGGLEIVTLRRKQENLRKLNRAVSQLCEVVEEAKSCETMVDEGKMEMATARIGRLESLISGSSADNTEESDKVQNEQRIDLRQMKALSGISEGIAQLRIRIGRGFEEKFKDALLTDVREHVKSVPAKDTLQRWANASFRSRPNHTRKMSTSPAYLNTNEKLRPELTAALVGLSRAGHTARATTAYREAVMREIKSMLRQHLPSSSDDDADSTTSVSTRGGRKRSQQEKSSILARNLRALDPEAMEDLLVKVYTSVGEALRRLGIQVKVLLDVTSTMESVPVEPKGSDDASAGLQQSVSQANQIRDEVTQALDLSSLLGQAVDAVQGQISKILRVRREENTHLPLSQFLRYFVLNRLFADECEAVSSQSGDSLKEVVNSQIKDFVVVMAEREKQHIRRTLEQDRWEAKDFGPYESVVLDRVLEGMTTTPKAWTDYVELWATETSNAAPSTNGAATNGDGTTGNAKVRSATIDEQRYILVNSAQSALFGIDNFAHLLAAIPAVTPDAATHLLAYLKLFNSHACQLILGAGATKSAGLKNITSKHLALASQACSFIVALLPYVRELVRRHLPSSTTNNATVLAEFDRVKRLFQDHQTSIHDKLVEIMGARSAAHIAGFRKLDFDALAKQQQGDAAPSKPIEDLCKETGTLHRVLSRHVSELDLKMIMMPIFAAYREEWSRALGETVVKTEPGKRR